MSKVSQCLIDLACIFITYSVQEVNFFVCSSHYMSVASCTVDLNGSSGLSFHKMYRLILCVSEYSLKAFAYCCA